MLVLAVTLHNIPEGMAVGVVFAGWMTGNSGISLGGALALSLGIAIQNFPEGAIISMPLYSAGSSRHRAFRNGVLSGVVEPDRCHSYDNIRTSADSDSAVHAQLCSWSKCCMSL